MFCNQNYYFTYILFGLLSKLSASLIRFFKTNHMEDIKKYKDLNHQVQRQSRRAYWSYIEGILTVEGDKEETNTNKGTSKRFWTYVKHKKSDKSGVSPLKQHGKLEADPTKQANILNDQFKSVFSVSEPITSGEFTDRKYMKDGPSDYPEADNIIISESGVLKLLQNLNAHKAGGPDNIKPTILKELAGELAPILSIIFNKSLESGEIPSDWKKARITPAFKKGKKYLPSNYRPISLTCVCCKIMEHIVTSHIMNHAERNNILYPLQHGFRSKRSCETQLLECIDDLSKNLEDGKQTDLLILDFSKAFDKVSHNLLLHKLHHYGIRGNTHRWISAFLSERTQVVVVDGEESDVGRVESGVPQGSVLGPSLFLFYINDLPENLNSTVRLFADDTIVYLTITSASDCQTLQEDLNKLATWEHLWKMEFHPDKCTVLTVSKKKNPIIFDYTLHNHTLAHEESTKYLGCTITSDLNWGTHISNICKKANQTLGFLHRNLHISSRSIKERACKSLVRPQLEYSSTVWDPYQQGHIDMIEKVQRRAARYVMGKYRNRSSVGDMLQQLEWKSLRTRRTDARLCMMYKIVNNKVAIDPANYFTQPIRRSRHMYQHAFAVPSATKDSRKWSFFCNTIRDWNSLPPDIAAAKSLEIFKSQVTKTH